MKDCSLLENSRIFLGCEKDSDCVELSTTGIVKHFVSQVLNKNSDLTDRKRLMEGAVLFLSAMIRRKLK